MGVIIFHNHHKSKLSAHTVGEYALLGNEGGSCELYLFGGKGEEWRYGMAMSMSTALDILEIVKKHDVRIDLSSYKKQQEFAARFEAGEWEIPVDREKEELRQKFARALEILERIDKVMCPQTLEKKHPSPSVQPLTQDRHKQTR